MKLLPLLIFFAALQISFSQTPDRTTQVKKENQPIADQGNGYYKNPILAGNFGDPSIITIGEDYYMAFSRSNGVMIWHSRDLVNWKPLHRHRLPEGYNTVWAIDLQYFNEQFHIYMPIREYPGKGDKPFGNFVIRAERPEGPWSDPIHLEIPIPEANDYSGIDPGFIQTPEGEKFLYVNHGYAMKLNKEGTRAVSTPEVVYEGWPYPESWTVECFCLESPKLFKKGDYYYMVSAQGGTSGPSTAHMSVVARARHPLGPWENSPYNPLVRTYSHNEPFWHQGHGTVFEDKDGGWWTIYHGRINSFTEMGRPTLLLPVSWTDDGWPVIKGGQPSGELIPMPEGENLGHGMPISDNFESDIPGPQWYFDNAKKNLIEVGDGRLTLSASGSEHRQGTEVYSYAPNKSFEVSVKIENPSEENISGLRLGYDGLATDGKNIFFTEGPNWRTRRSVFPLEKEKPVWIRLKNFRKDISFYYSQDGQNWKKFSDSIRSHDSYRFSIFSAGEGKVAFRAFVYKGLE